MTVWIKAKSKAAVLKIAMRLCRTKLARRLLRKCGYSDTNVLCVDDVYPLRLYAGKYGVEIGGPSVVFSDVYAVCAGCDGVNFSADTIWWQKDDRDVYIGRGRGLGHIYITDATALSCLSDDKYDFCMSSNNLEHIANPLRALLEAFNGESAEKIVMAGGYDSFVSSDIWIGAV